MPQMTFAVPLSEPRGGGGGQHPVSSSTSKIFNATLTVIAPVDAADDRCGAPVRGSCEPARLTLRPGTRIPAGNSLKKIKGMYPKNARKSIFFPASCLSTYIMHLTSSKINLQILRVLVIMIRT